MEPFARLAEDCIAEILSFTKPVDASKSCAVSKGFKSAAESNYVWNRFLPPDYGEIISTSSSSHSLLKHATSKDLFFSLCESPVLIHGGKMSFSLGKRDGKKCFMVGARELQISWKGCWDFVSHTNSRFSEVAKLRSIGWIHIQGKIKTQMLSQNTTYAAYLVFWLERMDGLKSSTTIVKFLKDPSKESKHNDKVESRGTGKMATKRNDGWIEIELGKFHNGDGDNDEVEAWLVEINSPHDKSGFLVEGIEFRPA